VLIARDGTVKHRFCIARAATALLHQDRPHARQLAYAPGEAASGSVDARDVFALGVAVRVATLTRPFTGDSSRRSWRRSSMDGATAGEMRPDARSWLSHQGNMQVIRCPLAGAAELESLERASNA
jgi:hypothetical protein